MEVGETEDDQEEVISPSWLSFNKLTSREAHNNPHSD